MTLKEVFMIKNKMALIILEATSLSMFILLAYLSMWMPFAFTGEMLEFKVMI